MKTKIYISGKITGCDPVEVTAKFNQAKEHITALGHIPVSPLDNGLPTDATWKEHMIKDIMMLLGCDKVFALADWGQSKGACIEVSLAHKIGMDIIYEIEE